ncbi:hypothetical protein [Methylobacterium sp. Leaf108]|uniref:hypothetical protein n=1 Tax=Methylobacterium sp. Leaf108 TaxID=1736256 RepID=UPI0006F6A239|nr:hypothetical protein [Methylobacterium sp. Leaf108]KQP55051.1 hypothetical protein ASF39_04770 [Methylobacterium sp. Leaf108]
MDGYIRQAWDQAGFTPELPPFQIIDTRDDATSAPRVAFSAPQADILEFTPAQAMQFANGITDLLDGIASRFVVSGSCAGERAGVVGEKRGRGFALKVAGSLVAGSQVTVIGLTTSVARDLARLLADRAAKATDWVS